MCIYYQGIRNSDSANKCPNQNNVYVMKENKDILVHERCVHWEGSV